MGKEKKIEKYNEYRYFSLDNLSNSFNDTARAITLSEWQNVYLF